MKKELKQLATSEENIEYKKLSQEIFFYGFRFFKRYTKPYILLKNLLANKIGINAVKTKPEKSIAERTKLRRYILDEIAKQRKTVDLNLCDYYFKYSSLSNMYKELNEREAEKNKVKVHFIEDDMTNLKKDIENASKDEAEKIETLNKIKDIVELILYFNNEGR